MRLSTVVCPKELDFPDVRLNATKIRTVKYFSVGNAFLSGYVHNPAETSNVKLVKLFHMPIV